MPPYQKALDALRGVRIAPQPRYAQPESYGQDVAARNEAFDRLPRPPTAFTPSEIPDPRAQLLSLQDQRLRETMQPQFMDRPDISQLQGLLAGDIAANPLTQQAADVAGTEQANLAAYQQGFTGGTPTQTAPGMWSSEPSQSPSQQAGSVVRGMEMAKIQAPERAAQVTAQGRIGEADISGQAQRDVAKTRADQLTDMNNQLMLMLSGGRRNAVDVKGVSLPGGGSVTLQSQPSVKVAPSQWTALSNAAEAYQKARVRWFGDPTPEKVQLDSIIMGIVQSFPADDSIKAQATKYNADSTLDQYTSEQVGEAFQTKYPNVDPEDVQDLVDLMAVYRFGK